MAVVVVSCGPLVGCYYFLEASGWWLGWLLLFPGGCGGGGGHNGNAHATRAKNDTSKKVSQAFVFTNGGHGAQNVAC